MTTTQTPSTLTPQDLALVELLHAERFNINALINKKNPFHPAQTSILTLLDWVDLPHIDAAIQRIVSRTQSLSAKADDDARLIAKKSLSHALAVAASMIPHFDSCPDDPEQAELFAKHTETLIRETRLLAGTLLKLSPTPPSPRARRGTSTDSSEIDNDIASDTASDSDNPTSSDAATSDSTESTRATPSTIRTTPRAAHAPRLNRNSRKPAFSPAEVAEILSALLDHEHDLKSRNTSSHNPTTSPNSSPDSQPLDASLPTAPAHS